jgi:hypothetical protein
MGPWLPPGFDLFWFEVLYSPLIVCGWLIEHPVAAISMLIGYVALWFAPWIIK